MPIIGLSVFLGVIYEISPWLASKPWLGIPFFIMAVSVLSGLAILPTNIVGIASGWAFGFSAGLATMLAAIAGGVSLNFFIARRLGGKHLNRIIVENPRFNAIHRALLQGNTAKVVTIIILLRLSPATPFAATNFMLAASGVSLRSFVIGTVLGYLPRTAATALVGSSLHKLSFEQPRQIWLLILGIVATIIAIIAIAILSKRALARLTNEELKRI